MKNTAEILRAAHDLLGRVEGIKSFIRRSRSEGALGNEEFTVLMHYAGELDRLSRSIVADREKRHERAGGNFNTAKDLGSSTCFALNRR